MFFTYSLFKKTTTSLYINICQIVATWQGGFLGSSFFQNFKTKYLLRPDPTIHFKEWEKYISDAEIAESKKKAQQSSEYLVRHQDA